MGDLSPWHTSKTDFLWEMHVWITAVKSSNYHPSYITKFVKSYDEFDN